MKMNMRLWLGSILTVLLLIPAASAFGVSSPYWTDNPLVMEPGESREVILSLQNMLGGEDMTIQAEMIGGSEIATIIDSDTVYPVDFGERHVPVTLSIAVPGDAELGSAYSVNIEFKEVKASEGSFVGLSTAVATSFPVQVGESAPEVEVQYPVEPQQGPNYLWIGLILIALLAVVAYLYKKR